MRRYAVLFTVVLAGCNVPLAAARPSKLPHAPSSSTTTSTTAATTSTTKSTTTTSTSTTTTPATTTTTSVPSVTGNVTIDYTRTIAVSPLAFGLAETGYESPSVLANDPLEQQRVAALHVGAMRMDLHYSTSGDPTSKIICGGAGCDTGPTGDQWIASIKGAGAQPVVIVKTQSTVDAANMVRHFNINPATGLVDPTLPNYVARWIVGNEPDNNGYSPASYAGYFNADYDAMKAVDPNIKIGGPTVAWYDATWIQQFLQLSGSRVDFVDFHEYAQQGCDTCTTNSVATLLSHAASQGNDVAKLRKMIATTVPARAAQIDIQVGEWSLDWDGGVQMNSNFMSVWTADVLGNILENGGLSMYYGTKGNALKSSTATVTDDFGRQIAMHVDDPRAAYWGYAMLTGAGLFPSVGAQLAATTTTLANVDVFAGTQTIVVVNKDQTAAPDATFSVSGRSVSSVDVWQRNQMLPFNLAPVHLGPVAAAGETFSYTLPPMSVTTFVLNP